MTSSLQVSEAPDPLFSSLIESGQLSLDAFARARRLATLLRELANDGGGC